MSNLYIIGNGFDIAHGINSSYEDFHKYLLQKYAVTRKAKWVFPYLYANNKECGDFETANFLIKLISIAEKDGKHWRDFENSLGKLDYARFFQSDDMDEYIKMTQRSMEIAIPKIKLFFSNWIQNINLQHIKKIEAFEKQIDPDKDYFISFNYTPVLEILYGAKNVCHVHGNANGNIILGHGDNSEFELVPLYDYSDEKRRKNRSFKNNRMFKIERTEETFHERYLSREEKGFCKFHLVNETNGSVEGKIKTRLFYQLGHGPSLSMHEIKPQHKGATNTTNLQIDEVEKVLQNIHASLRKDTSSALITLIKFLSNIDLCDTIDNIYSIGFSYADVDMKIIQIISMLGARAWYLNNYDYDNLKVYAKKIRKSSYGGIIGQFDFTRINSNGKLPT